MDIKDQLKDIPIDQVAERLGLNLQRFTLVMMAVCFVLMPQNVPAQQKIFVQIESGQDDGKVLSYQVKEKLSKSNIYKLTSDQSKPRIVLRVISWKIWTTIIYCVINDHLLYGPDDLYLIFVNNITGYSSTQNLPNAAEEIIAGMDEAIKIFSIE
jgi:hypothetical protein